MRTRIWLTGFQPFGSHSQNPSQKLVEQLLDTVHSQEIQSLSPYGLESNSIELELTEVKQDTRSVFVGSATAAQLDAICSVPNLDPMLSSEEFGAKLYSRNMPDNQWQRVVNVSRIRDISKFIDKEDSFIFNPVVLYLDTTANSQYAELTLVDSDNGKHKANINFDFVYVLS